MTNMFLSHLLFSTQLKPSFYKRIDPDQIHMYVPGAFYPGGNDSNSVWPGLELSRLYYFKATIGGPDLQWLQKEF